MYDATGIGPVVCKHERVRTELHIRNHTVIACDNDLANGVEYFLPSFAVDCHRTAQRHCGRANFEILASGRTAALIWHTGVICPSYVRVGSEEVARS